MRNLVYGILHCKALDCVVFILTLVGFFATFALTQTWVMSICFVLGTIGVFYCGFYLYIWWRRPIERDAILVHNDFIWKVLSFVMLVPFVLAAVAYTIDLSTGNCHLTRSTADETLFYSIYEYFMDGNSQFDSQSRCGRGVAAIIAMLGILLMNGLFTSSILSWFEQQKAAWTHGEARYDSVLAREEHSVIIGGHSMTQSVVRYLLNRQQETNTKRYILIQTSREVAEYRRELFSHFTEIEQRDIVIYYGNRNTAEDIRSLHIAQASDVYILGEEANVSDLESYHDTLNMSCLALIDNECRNVSTFHKGNEAQKLSDTRLKCHVMFEYQTTFAVFKTTDINEEKIIFLPFSQYEMLAQKVLVCQNAQTHPYTPLDSREGITAQSDDFVHLIVVGMSRVGVSMAIEAAYLAHYPNFETKRKRTRITFIDSKMKQEKAFFTGRFKELFSLVRTREVSIITENTQTGKIETTKTPLYGNDWNDPILNNPTRYAHLLDEQHQDNFLDIEWEFVDGSVEHPLVQDYLRDAVCADHSKVTIAVCLPENNRAVAAAIYLPDEVYERAQEIWVYQHYNDKIVHEISEQNPRYKQKLKGFGMINDGYDFALQLKVNDLASIVSKAYDIYMYGKTNQDEVEMPQTKPCWLTSLWRKICPSSPADTQCTSMANAQVANAAKNMWSNNYNVLHAWTKMRCLELQSTTSLTEAHQQYIQEMEHNRWNMEQLLLRYSTLTKEEQMACSTDSSCKGRLKGQFKHLDLCANQRLPQIETNKKIVDLDVELFKAIYPYL